MRLPVVYLVRHGETEWSKSGQHTSTTEVELTENGVKQAQDLSRFVFENQCQDFIEPKNITQIYVSPRKRAQQTLSLINLPEKEKIPVFTEPNISEWSYGDYEGITAHEIRSTKFAFWDIWQVIHGCPNGETIQQVATRCDHVTAKIMAYQTDHMDNNPNSPGGDVLVVAHSHLLRILACRWLNLPPEHGRHFLIDTAQTTFSNDFVRTVIKYDSILENHNKYNSQNARNKTFQGGPTLAYVTPWNNHGYDIAKIFKGKFDYVSPVWYNIYRRSTNQYELTGGHDVDHNWIKEISEGRHVKVVPRFQFQDWTQIDYQMLITELNEIDSLVNTLSLECRKQGFGGLVLEASYIILLRNFVMKLGAKLHDQSQELILVLSPRKPSIPYFTADQFDDFSQFVDGFSLMTYDYSSHETPGPNAPINWVEDNILSFTPTTMNRGKLLLGMNMYGMDFSQGRAEHITGNTIIKIIRQHKPIIEWNENLGEHYFQYQENGLSHTVWYPSLKSIESRLQLAEDYDTGLSIWEIGQGLDYFYDLL
ncbi:14400_t:CDS:10 [Dentiscutata erythropus]|uniref:Chitinase domain-containing protein 1 n=1 Tax=Dentiscutata erythropus TaxID=1348616 RepID=A0A9N9NMU1_9GLOM|nr:14400_t:CDS:10 [Dentiscutata erythropus]